MIVDRFYFARKLREDIFPFSILYRICYHQKIITYRRILLLLYSTPIYLYGSTIQEFEIFYQTVRYFRMNVGKETLYLSQCIKKLLFLFTITQCKSHFNIRKRNKEKTVFFYRQIVSLFEQLSSGILHIFLNSTSSYVFFFVLS